MYKFILQGFLGVAILSVGSVATAKAKYGPAGCGLGSIIIGTKPGIMQLLGSTSNGTSGNQSFGITSGTLNCDASPDVWVQQEQEHFIAHNLANLAVELSQGGGPTVEGYSNVFGCPIDMSTHFTSTLRSSYSRIFMAPGAMAILDATVVELKADPILSTHCNKLI
jgi:hypothetical protein